MPASILVSHVFVGPFLVLRGAEIALALGTYSIGHLKELLKPANPLGAWVSLLKMIIS